MRKLIVQEWISLDGHVSDKDGKLDFFASTVRDIYNADVYRKLLTEIDCMLLGRKTYEQFAAVWPRRKIQGDLLAEEMNTVDKIVFSNVIAKAPWGEWKSALVMKGDPRTHVRDLKALPGKNMVIWGSLSLAQPLMQAGMVDEYHIHICPVVTGGGRKLFPEGLSATAFSLADSERDDNGVVSLHYKVVTS